MRTNKVDDYTYTKELDEIELYFMNLLERFAINDDDFLQETIETVITEAVKRVKRDVIKNSSNYNKINNSCTALTLPANPTAGDGPYFDLDTKTPIWFDGEHWVDALKNIIYEGNDA